MMSFDKYLFLFAHMDDETLLSYGFIRKLLEQNCDVNLVCMCGNSRREDPNAIRRRLTFDAIFDNSKINQICLDNYDLELDYNVAKKQIHNIVDKLRPEVVITHSLCDLHFEHQIISKLLHLECRMKPASSVKALYEISLPQEAWNFSNENRFRPNFFVDISAYEVDKVNAMEKYYFELPSDPNDLRSAKSMQIMNQHYGQVIGVRSCEAYQQQFCIA